MSSVTQNPEFQIPVEDISAFLQNPSSPEAQIVIDSVRAACTTSAFFQPRENGISEGLVEALFQGAKALFALPLEEKKTLKRPGTKTGYDIMGAQALQHGALPDMKEGYYIGKDMAIDAEQTSRSFMTPNIWPSVKRVPEAVFKKPMVDYYGAVEALCLRPLEVIAAALPQGPDVLDELKEEPIVASMRLLHYPPPKSTAEKQFSAGAHTDFGVQKQKTGQWVLVPLNENDLLQHSNLHRVLNLGDADCYSVPYFFDGCLDANLKRLDGADEDRILNVKEHMLERFATAYSTAYESRGG
ncbi:citrinin biosynthesis oxygenase CtnA [Phyllosticta citricarpa]|uniref:Citrinin biosynthesis oxygenase CtnA n=1 Tax=Phyllosticta citricarpa TaxID=55181 RepID=A0ABR1MKK6_9PEZI